MVPMVLRYIFVRQTQALLLLVCLDLMEIQLLVRLVVIIVRDLMALELLARGGILRVGITQVNQKNLVLMV